MKMKLWLFSMVVTFVVPAHALEVAFETDRTLPIVHLNMAFRVGGAHDPQSSGNSLDGLSNFVGEMLLRGTELRTKEQLDTALDEMGATLVFETRAEASILRGAVLSSQLDSFLKLLEEITSRPKFHENEIRKLKSEISSGLLDEMGSDSALASKRFQRLLFQGHPYGRPVDGTTRSIAKMRREDIVKFYETYFREKNLTVVGTGDTDASRIRDWADHWSTLRSGGTAPAPVTRPMALSQRKVELIDKPDRTQTQIRIGQIGTQLTDPDYFALYLANHVLGGDSFSSRLMVEIRVKRGWSYGAYSAFRFGTQPRFWAATLFPASKDTPAALAETLRQLEFFQSHGITEEELDFAKHSLVNKAGFMSNTTRKRVENRLLERTLDLPNGFFSDYAKRIQPLSRESVNLAISKYWKPDTLAITVVGTAVNLKDALAQAVGVKPEGILVTPYQQE